MRIFKKTIYSDMGFGVAEDPFYFYASDIDELSEIMAAKCEQLGLIFEDVVIAKINRQCGNVYEWCVYVKLQQSENVTTGE